MLEDELEDLRELWTSAPGRFQLVDVRSEHGSLLPYDLHHEQAVLIEDDELHQRVVELMIGAGVPVVRMPVLCLVSECREGAVRPDLCGRHAQEYEAAQ